eukprot:CAMPEP_0183348532 /NCGR_PEP_ID=MMETSP0164_2-20130417/13016_1 /TAXON_ID=221442 /ORGANISM="Coccolithus pelagicus ssp braarudi, Strain PLY182g" /LENGTH=105 /DNA_ID=CAMNT_0025520143 /DNA_START=190 /DNA_END=504 /DNA_ORIENTATION=-
MPPHAKKGCLPRCSACGRSVQVRVGPRAASSWGQPHGAPAELVPSCGADGAPPHPPGMMPPPLRAAACGARARREAPPTRAARAARVGLQQREAPEREAWPAACP